MLSIPIDDQLTLQLNNISNIASCQAMHLSTLDEVQLATMHRMARVSTIGASTRIENAVLTNTEIAWLDDTLSKDARPSAFDQDRAMIEDKLSKDKERSIEEVAGCRAMLDTIFDEPENLFPLTQTTIKGLHHQLMQHYPPAKPYIGRYKIAPNSVVQRIVGTNIQQDVLRTADPGPITDAAMHDLVDWYNSTLHETPWPIAAATEFVFRFLAIHPFQDGNGRIGRGLFLLALLQSNDVHLRNITPYISIDRHIEMQREPYYLALRKCSDGKFRQDTQEYHMEHLLRFLLKMCQRAVERDVEYYTSRYTTIAKLVRRQRQVYEVFRDNPERRIGLSTLLELTDIPRRTAIHALQQLVKNKLLQKNSRASSTHYQLIF